VSAHWEKEGKRPAAVGVARYSPRHLWLTSALRGAPAGALSPARHPRPAQLQTRPKPPRSPARAPRPGSYYLAGSGAAGGDVKSVLRDAGIVDVDAVLAQVADGKDQVAATMAAYTLRCAGRRGGPAAAAAGRVGGLPGGRGGAGPGGEAFWTICSPGL
jgi:hypothetical protein